MIRGKTKRQNPRWDKGRYKTIVVDNTKRGSRRKEKKRKDSRNFKNRVQTLVLLLTRILIKIILFMSSERLHKNLW
jgi:hypothetical protein